MQVIGCQTDIQWGDKAANHERVRQLLADCTPVAPALIVLPEMFSTGFSMQTGAIAESADGPTNRFLADLARDKRCHVVGGVVALGADGRGRNQAAVFGTRGEEVARYDKIYPFSFAGETQFYTGGDDVVLFEIGPWRIAPFVCYDLRFPEVFRRAAERGANLLVVIANWPQPRIAHWTSLLVARAIENQAYVVGVNRTGSDPQVQYNGHSLIVDPRGQIVVQAGDRPTPLIAEFDLDALVAYRRQFPALSDMRPEFLGRPA